MEHGGQKGSSTEDRHATIDSGVRHLAPIRHWTPLCQPTTLLCPPLVPAHPWPGGGRPLRMRCLHARQTPACAPCRWEIRPEWWRRESARAPRRLLDGQRWTQTPAALCRVVRDTVAHGRWWSWAAIAARWSPAPACRPVPSRPPSWTIGIRHGRQWCSGSPTAALQTPRPSMVREPPQNAGTGEPSTQLTMPVPSPTHLECCMQRTSRPDGALEKVKFTQSACHESTTRVVQVKGKAKTSTCSAHLQPPGLEAQQVLGWIQKVVLQTLLECTCSAGWPKQCERKLFKNGCNCARISSSIPHSLLIRPRRHGRRLAIMAMEGVRTSTSAVPECADIHPAPVWSWMKTWSRGPPVFHVDHVCACRWNAMMSDHHASLDCLFQVFEFETVETDMHEEPQPPAFTPWPRVHKNSQRGWNGRRKLGNIKANTHSQQFERRLQENGLAWGAESYVTS